MFAYCLTKPVKNKLLYLLFPHIFCVSSEELEMSVFLGNGTSCDPADCMHSLPSQVVLLY